MIVDMFGAKCEVVVHDFSDLQHSLIHIAGNVTSRKIGSPITDLVLNELNKSDTDIEDIPSYRSQSSKGQVMKSTTVFLRDEENRVIGALCTNYDISLLMEMDNEMKQFIDFREETQDEQISETFYKSVHDVIHDMVDQVIRPLNKAPSKMTVEEKVYCVHELNEKGIFLIKGATEYVARVLGVSKFTVYNYLNKVRAEKEYIQQ